MVCIGVVSMCAGRKRIVVVGIRKSMWSKGGLVGLNVGVRVSTKD